MAMAIAMIMFHEDTPPDVADIQRELVKRWPELLVVTEAEQQDSTISFRLGGSDVILGKIATPIPWSELEGPCATSVLWPNAANEIRQHKLHWIVSVSDELTLVELSTLLTQTISAVLAACPAAVGVYWGSATLVIPKDVFIDFAETLLPQELPVPIWIDFRVGRETENFSSGFTTGMTALGHMEFEVTRAQESPAELHEHLMTFASYVLENGPVVRDGDTIGMDADERIRVIYADSTFGHKGKVMRLEFESLSKPWWKIWR